MKAYTVVSSPEAEEQLGARVLFVRRVVVSQLEPSKVNDLPAARRGPPRPFAYP